MKTVKFNTRLMAPVVAPEDAAASAPADESSSESVQGGEQASTDVINALHERIGLDDTEPESSAAEEEAEDSSVDTAEEEVDDEQSQEESESEEESEEETDDEQEEDDSEESDEEEDESEEEESKEDVDLKDLDPKARAAAQKVIDRVVGKVRAKKQEAIDRAEAAEGQVAAKDTEIQQLQAQNTELQAAKVVPAPTAQNPLSNHVDAESLNRLEQDSRSFKRWAIENPDGGPCPLILDNEKQPVELTQQQVRSMQAMVEEDLEVNIPGRRIFLQEDSQYNGVAMQLFPQLKDKTHELTMRVNDVLKSAPEFKNRPGSQLGAIFYEIGRRFVEQHKEQSWDVLNGAKPAAKEKKLRKPVAKKVKKSPVPAAKRPARVPRSKAAAPTGGELNESQVVDTLNDRFG